MGAAEDDTRPVTTIPELQVLQAIILLVTVDMVDSLFGQERASERPRHDESMLQDIAFVLTHRGERIGGAEQHRDVIAIRGASPPDSRRTAIGPAIPAREASAREYDADGPDRHSQHSGDHSLSEPIPVMLFHRGCHRIGNLTGTAPGLPYRDAGPMEGVPASFAGNTEAASDFGDRGTALVESLGLGKLTSSEGGAVEIGRPTDDAKAPERMPHDVYGAADLSGNLTIPAAAPIEGRDPLLLLGR
jgi:hypothetical protein